MKILVCDDKEEGKETLDAVTDGTEGLEGVEVFPCFADDLGHALKGLEDRLKAVNADPAKLEEPGDLVFDGYDLVLLDNNLTSLPNAGLFLTAEAVISYIRAFSSAKYIVSLNKNFSVDFDLQHLLGDRETRADLALNTQHLDNRGLWTGDPDSDQGGFLPWYWPRLKDVASRRAEQIKLVQENLDEPILQVLGMVDHDVVPFMSAHARSLFSVGDSEEEGPIASTTFREVFKSNERVYPDHEARDRYADDDRFRLLVARTVAAAMDRWFRLDLLGPQEVLVDLPHLIQRMPFLLGSSASDLSAWNRALEAEAAPFGLEHEQGAERVMAARLKSPWTDRPAFVWSRIKNDPVLQELFYNSDAEWASAIFCEDLSRFVPMETEPQSFVVDLDGSWRRRYVRKLPGFGYRPDSYLAT